MAKKTTSRKPNALGKDIIIPTSEKVDNDTETLPDVLMDWWEGKRPVGWTLSQHLENPTINCTGSIRDEELAKYVGQHLNQQQKFHHNPS